MKAFSTRPFVLAAALILTAAKFQAQVFATGQQAGTVGDCTECAISNPVAAADGDMNTYSRIVVDDSLAGSYVYQNLLFSSPASGGEYVALMVESGTGTPLDQAKLGNTHICLYTNNVLTGDTLAAGDYAITPADGFPGKYLLEFIAVGSFDCVQLHIHSGMVGTVNELNLYEGYYSNGTLPITLKDFKAIREKATVLVSWKTVTETNNHFFTIERSIDGQVYEHIAEVKGAGNSQIELSYQFVDKQPLLNLSYYRISQTDLNGHVQYFPATIVDALETEHLLEVYPNPSAGGDLTITLLESGEATVAIIGLGGNRVYEATIPAGNGITALHIPSTLDKGIYTVCVSSDDGLKTKRVVIN